MTKYVLDEQTRDVAADTDTTDTESNPYVAFSGDTKK